MRTTLLTATLAALIAIGTLPAAAAEGPGHETPRASRPAATTVVEYDARWRYDSDSQDGYHSGYDDRTPDRDWQNRPSNAFPWAGGPNNGYDQYQHRQPLPHWVIRQKLARQHFRDFDRWKLKNGQYRIDAENWRGHDVRLIVDAYNGRILDVQRRR